MAINTVSLFTLGSANNARTLLNNILKKDYEVYKSLQEQEADAVVKFSSYGDILNSLSVLKSTVDNLKNMSSGILTAEVSNTTFLKATALSFGTPSNHTFQVNNIATSQTIDSSAFSFPAKTSDVADLTTYATQKLSIQVGSGTATEITVDSSNNTLSGISDSINSANAGVTAEVENSGFVIDASNNTIAFNNGSDKTATLANNTYTSSGLARAIKSALETADGGYNTYTVSYDSTANKFSITNDSTNSTQITVDWTNSTARNTLGFATTDQSTVGLGNSATSDTTTAGSGFSLVLSANSTGANNNIIIKADVNNDGTYSEAGAEIAQAGLAKLAFNATYDASGNVTGGIANMTQSRTAVDAHFKVDSVEYTRSNNSVSDVINGLALNLVKGDPFYSTAPKTMTIATYPLLMVNNLRFFASTFSSAKSYFNTLDGSGSEAGALGGDTSFRSLMDEFNSLKDKRYIAGSNIQSLSYIGISFDAYGNATFDETKLKNSIAEDATGVTNIASQMALPFSNMLDNYINTIIPKQQDEYNTSYEKIKSAQKKILSQVDIKQRTFLASVNSSNMLATMFQSSANLTNSIAGMISKKV